MKKRYALLLFIYYCSIGIANAQKLLPIKGNIAENSSPVGGISLWLNHRFVGNSNLQGDFELSAFKGDTLTLESPFYTPYTHIIKDTLFLHIALQPSSRMLKEVNVHNYSHNYIYALLRQAFSQVQAIPHLQQLFLRQALVENNTKNLLFNEGILSMKLPAYERLGNLNYHSGKIRISIDAICNTINQKSRDVHYAADPQSLLLRAYYPAVYFDIISGGIDSLRMQSEDEHLIISIRGKYPKKNDTYEYTYTIAKKTKNLIKASYYIETAEAEKIQKVSWLNNTYQNGQLCTAFANAKVSYRGNSYTLDEELFMGKKLDQEPAQYDLKRYHPALQNYLKTKENCPSVQQYKAINDIPNQTFY